MRPFVFVSCSLTHAPMEFVRDMMAFQKSVAEICDTNNWDADPTGDPMARSDDNESADICEAIFRRHSQWVRQADAVIAELSYPSTGAGIELGIACERGIPILLMARAGSRVSPFVRGMPTAVYREYNHPNELIELVRNELLPRVSRS